MSSLQSIMNLEDDQQDASSPMGKKDKDSPTPASGFRVQDPSTSPSSGHVTRSQQPYPSALTTPTIRTSTAEDRSPYYPGQQQSDTDPRSGSVVQRGKRPAEPSLAAASLSAASSGPGDSRRQSSTSADSMDQHGYGSAASSSSMGGGAGGGGYPPNHPRRPMGSPGPDVPIRLTPITGRVSRAKKGVPVHVCEICNPPKTFTRAEHLRRHQLSHQQPQYGCDKCDRAFHRLDLLTRHQQRHNEGDNASQSGGASRRGSKDSAGTLEERMSASRVGSLQPPGYSSSSQVFGGASTPSSVSDIAPATPPAGSRPGSAMTPPQGGSGEQYGPSPGHQASNSYGNYTFQPNPPMIHQAGSMEPSPEPPQFTTIDYMAAPRTTHMPLFVATHGLASSSTLHTTLDNPPDLVHTTDYSPWTSASEGPYSTPPEAPVRRRTWRHTHQNSIEWHPIPPLLSAFPTGARPEISTSGSLETMDGPYYVTTSFADSSQLAPHIAPSHVNYSNLGSLVTAYDDEQTQSLLDPTIAAQHAMHQRSSSVRSPPPTSTSTSGQVADTLVMPAPLLHRLDSMTQVPQKELVVGDGTQEVAMGVLGGDGGSPHWNGAVLTSPSCGIGGMMLTPLPRSVRNAIPTYVEVYWERFHNFCPVVHRPSFEGIGGEVLRCAMAAVATQFLNGKEDRIRGNQLHEYAWQEAKRAVQWNLQVMQAILLCELFARFRGRKAVVRPSKLFENLYSRDLYQTPNLYDPALPSSAASFGTHQSLGVNPTNEQRWHTWLEAEGRRRLLAGCFVVDSHSSVFQQQPRARDDVDPSTIPSTAHSDALWAANTAEEWAAMLEANPGAGRPQCLPRLSLLEPEQVARYSVFDQISILNAAAQSLPRRYTPRLVTGKGDGSDDSTHDDLRTPTTASYAQALNKDKADDRLAELFSHCVPAATTANTYLALHHTPLHDLLAVSGDSWVFSQKILGSPTFLDHQKRLKAWAEGRSASATASATTSTSGHQGTPSSPTTAGLEGMSSAKATIYAARALAEYLTRGVDSSNGLTPYMAGLSDYWGMYVCALIIWAFGHRPGKSVGSSGSSGSPITKGSNGSSSGGGSSSSSTPMGEDEAINWLRAVADLAQPEHVARVRGRREASAAVVSMIKRRLEADCVGGRSRLYVDAVGVLKKLEQGVHWRWF